MRGNFYLLLHLRHSYRFRELKNRSNRPLHVVLCIGAFVGAQVFEHQVLQILQFWIVRHRG